jgi:hypothetical protein
MDQRIASAYDQVAAQLEKLRDAYAQAGDIDGFQQKLTGFRLRYSNRPAMLRRIENTVDDGTEAQRQIERDKPARRFASSQTGMFSSC